MSSKVTYRQQYTRCGKERCRKCKDGVGHGPYWYAYWSENGRTISKYVGIRLPAHVEIERQHTKETGDTQETSSVEPRLITPAKGNSSPSHRSSDVPLQLSTHVLRVYALGQFRVDRLLAHYLAAYLANRLIGWVESKLWKPFGRTSIWVQPLTV